MNRLSLREARLLSELATHPGVPTPCDQLAIALFPSASDWEASSIRTPRAVLRTQATIQRIRRKFGGDVIVTIVGQGYRLGVRV